jgi:cardiolipin synthase
MKMKRDFLTIPNLLSLSRAVLAIPFVVVMLSSSENKRWWAVLILALGALTDKLDGVLARRWDLESEWGRVLDPLADKIGVATVALVLLWIGSIPAWFVVLVLARDLLILVGGLYLRKRTGIIHSSNITGKWSVGVFSLTLLVALIEGPPLVLTTLLVASAAMAVVSFVLYLQRFIITLGGEHSA